MDLYTIIHALIGVALLYACKEASSKLKKIEREHFDAKLRLNRLRNLEAVNKMLRKQLDD